MKHLKTTFLMLLLVNTVMAQKHFIGIKGGYSRTNAATEPSLNTSSVNGFAAGITYDFVSRKFFTLGTELLYDKRGYKSIRDTYFTLNGDVIRQEHKTVLRFHYIAMPVKLGFTTYGNFFATASAGIIPAIQVKSTSNVPTFDGNTLGYLGNSTADITEHLSKFDLAYFVEVGCGYKVSKKLQVISALRYQRSTTALGDDYFRNISVKSYGTTLNGGVRYQLK